MTRFLHLLVALAAVAAFSPRAGRAGEEPEDGRCLTPSQVGDLVLSADAVERDLAALVLRMAPQSFGVEVLGRVHRKVLEMAAHSAAQPTETESSEPVAATSEKHDLRVEAWVLEVAPEPARVLLALTDGKRDGLLHTFLPSADPLALDALNQLGHLDRDIASWERIEVGPWAAVPYVKDFDIEGSNSWWVSGAVVGVLHEGARLVVTAHADPEALAASLEMELRTAAVRRPIAEFETTWPCLADRVRIQLPESEDARIRKTFTLPLGTLALLGPVDAPLAADGRQVFAAFRVRRAPASSPLAR